MSERIIKTPHLPQGKVGLAAFGAKYREILEKPLQNRAPHGKVFLFQQLLPSLSCHMCHFVVT